MKSAVVAAVPEQFQDKGFTGIQRDAEPVLVSGLVDHALDRTLDREKAIGVDVAAEFIKAGAPDRKGAGGQTGLAGHSEVMGTGLLGAVDNEGVRAVCGWIAINERLATRAVQGDGWIEEALEIGVVEAGGGQRGSAKGLEFVLDALNEIDTDPVGVCSVPVDETVLGDLLETDEAPDALRVIGTVVLGVRETFFSAGISGGVVRHQDGEVVFSTVLTAYIESVEAAGIDRVGAFLVPVAEVVSAFNSRPGVVVIVGSENSDR